MEGAYKIQQLMKNILYFQMLYIQQKDKLEKKQNIEAK
jgi:hypothetical protein